MRKLIFFYLFCLQINSLFGQEIPCMQNGTCLKGKVIDPSEQGIEGIKIRLAGRPTNATSKGDEGWFEIPTLNYPLSHRLFLIVEDPQNRYYLGDSESDQVFEVKADFRQKGQLLKIVMYPIPKAKKPLKVAILPFCNFVRTKTELQPNAFIASLNEALQQIDGLECVPYAQSIQALRNAKISPDDFCNQEKLFEIAKKMGVDILITGVYQFSEGRLNVECQFSDVHRKKDFRGAVYMSRPEDEMAQSLQDLSLQILERLQLKPTPKEKERIYALHQSTRISHQILLLNALHFQEENRLAEADESLDQFLNQYPDNKIIQVKKVQNLVRQNRLEEAAKSVQKWKIDKQDQPKTLQEYLNKKDEENMPPPEEQIAKISFAMIKVPAGSFTMGSENYEDEKPIHQVSLDSFWISQTEITNQQFADFLAIYGSERVLQGEFKGQLMIKEHEWGLRKDRAKKRWIPQEGFENHPVVEVTWYGANQFCKFYGGRLPTEAEWEFAAKGATKTQNYKFSGSNNLNEVAWNDANSNASTQAVAQKKPNELGIFDMSGNVWEWCHDWYDKDFYAQSVGAKNPMSITEPKKKSKILRGGSWYSLANGCGISYRNSDNPESSSDVVGFRIVKLKDENMLNN